MKNLLIVLIVLMAVICCPQPVKDTPVTGALSDSSYVSFSSDSTEPDIKVKKTFYKAVGKDTFHYAVTEDDSVILWAIVRGEGVHLIRDL